MATGSDYLEILGPLDERPLACDPIDAARLAILRPSDRVARLASYAFAYLPWHGGSAEELWMQNELTPSTRDLLVLEAMSEGTPDWMDDSEAELLIIEIWNEYLQRIGYVCTGNEDCDGLVTIRKSV
jgi:hypothetical protein